MYLQESAIMKYLFESIFNYNEDILQVSTKNPSLLLSIYTSWYLFLVFTMVFTLFYALFRATCELFEFCKELTIYRKVKRRA